jgi:hypothetical protein
MQIVYRTYPGDGRKPRPEWFSKRACLANLLRVFGRDHQYHFIIDGGNGAYCQELYDFAKRLGVAPIVTEINERHNARAFRRTLDYACSLEGHLYLVEDDYLHRSGADAVLNEGGQCWDYCTCYDHPDKYLFSEHAVNEPPLLPATELTRLYLGERCHWFETPSTTATFAVRAETLRADREIWEHFSQDAFGWVRDHLAFTEIIKRGDRVAFTEIIKRRSLASTIPAYSTHCETRWLAPLVDWAEVNCQ